MRASTDKITIEYEMYGQGHETMILLPALGADCTMWRKQIDHFVSAYRVVCCNSGGHDDFSRSHDHVTLAEIAGGIIGVMDAIGLSYAHIVGLSMGGMVGQILAAGYPDRVASLVIASTTPTYPEQARSTMRDRAGVAEKEGMEALLDATLGRWFTPGFRESDPQDVEPIRRMLVSANPGSYAAAARAVSEVELASELVNVKAPTLVLAGGEDPSIPASSFDLLVGRIPGASGEVLDGVAHLSNVEAADRFNSLVSEFVEAASGPPSESEATDPMSPW